MDKGNSANEVTRVEVAKKFLTLLYANTPEKHFAYLWIKRGDEKITICFEVTDSTEIQSMAETAIEKSNKGFDVFCSICTTDKKIDSSHRAKSTDVSCQTAIWTDIDVQGGKHIGDKYPPNFETAQSFLPFEPSILVNSGYGLHGYYLLDQPLIITDNNRELATQTNKNLLDLIRLNAQTYSNSVDAVQDLARVLRVPGTFNYKLKESPQIVSLALTKDIRYNWADLQTRTTPVMPTVSESDCQPAADHIETPNLTDEEIIEKIRQSKQGALFSKLFDDGDTSDYADDHSSADLALMNILPFWVNGNAEAMERIFDLSDLAQRDKWKNRADYRKMTINTALESWNGKCYAMHDDTAEPLLAAPLDCDDKGNVRNKTKNYITILEKDSNLKGLIAKDDFSGKLIKRKKSFWSKLNDSNTAWTDADDAQLRIYIENRYNIRSPQLLSDAIIQVSNENRFHPVQEYLNNLPAWDGNERAEKFFVDTLGVDDSDYSRSITKHWLLAAIKRTFIPGCKFDYCLILSGSQGIGKSTVLSKLGGKWFNDSIDNINGKDALEQLQGSWIIELGEMQATKKAENEAIKSFISRTTDKVRLPYARRAEEFPRQCIFAATTNDSEPLKDKTGGRRFWILKSSATFSTTSNRLKILTDDYIEQVWAEVFYLYNQLLSTQGSVNLLPPSAILDEARKLQEEFTEGSEISSLIIDYLNIKIPKEEIWNKAPKWIRREFIKNNGQTTKLDDIEYVGEVTRQVVCSAEIANELFGIENINKEKATLREINTVLSNLKGWKRESGGTRMGVYNSQKNVYRRITSPITF